MSIVERYPLGARPDRYDPRDYQFAAVALAPVAATIDRKFYTMVNPDFRINQGSEGTCVAHAATNVLLAGPSPHRDYISFQTEELAHQFARDLYLQASGDSTYQQGMHPRDACAQLLQDDLIASYWKVMQPEDITTALLTFGPVMVTVPWYMSMYTVAWRFGHAYLKVNLESEHIGYHELALTGIDLEPDAGMPFYRVQNSWGGGWGENGTCRITIENFRRINQWDNWAFQETQF